jgi:hypothetical protein
VIHLVTTAHGAEEIYEQEFANNPARTEVRTQRRTLREEEVLQALGILVCVDPTYLHPPHQSCVRC